MSLEYGIAYGSDLGGDEIEPGIFVEAANEWEDGTHISEFGTYYTRTDGLAWVKSS